MTKIEKKLPVLFKLIRDLLTDVDSDEAAKLLNRVKNILTKPKANDYQLEVIANKMINIGADYDSFVSVMLFKLLPEDYNRLQLNQLEDELYEFIESEVLGKNLDKQFTRQLIRVTQQRFPELDKNQVKMRALSNWAWLIPFSLMHIILESIKELIENSILDDKLKNRKNKIRIKKTK